MEAASFLAASTLNGTGGYEAGTESEETKHPLKDDSRMMTEAFADMGKHIPGLEKKPQTSDGSLAGCRGSWRQHSEARCVDTHS